MNFKRFIVGVFLTLSLSFAYAQSGIQFYGGISNATNKDMLITPEGRSHPGYLIGADARLMDGNMYFVLGGQYHNVAFVAQEDKSYFSVEDGMNWLKLRVGLGYSVINVSDAIVIRAKSLVSFNFISGIPEGVSAPYTNYNAGTVGGVLGLGLDAFNFTFDIEIENGFFKAVNMVDGTEVNFFTMTLGYKI